MRKFLAASPENLIQHFIETASYDLTSESGIQTRLRKLVTDQGLRAAIGNRHSVYDKTLLVHSEKYSESLQQFEAQGFVGVYWWAHAAIAADWYRYARHDLDLRPQFDCIQKDFLVYNRAWAGTREYRLKFAEEIVNKNLQSVCLTSFSSHCENFNYTEYQPKNLQLKIQRWDLDQHLPPNYYDSTASADYVTNDYKITAIEVVLETLFDDSRWHLTEKSLRPIACGRPFILAATPGRLQYLRSYGFQTFDGLIDESYDTVQDSLQRLQCISKEMKRISELPAPQKQALWQKLYDIAAYNQQLFFSEAWQQSIFDEFVGNYHSAMSIMQQHRTGMHWKEARDIWQQIDNPVENLKHWDPMLKLSLQNQSVVEQLLQQAN